jgi:hypothetical protein
MAVEAVITNTHHVVEGNRPAIKVRMKRVEETSGLVSYLQEPRRLVKSSVFLGKSLHVAKHELCWSNECGSDFSSRCKM